MSAAAEAATDDGWRPGFAKRADNFDVVCAKAEGWRWAPGETGARVFAAVVKGTPTLTPAQRSTLLVYVECLNDERLKEGDASVWPSTGLVAARLGCGLAQARANRSALERAGFMVRDYNRANRPAGTEAYDLRPLMARLEELEVVDDEIRARITAQREALRQPVAFPSKYSAQALKSQHLEQTKDNFSYPVQEKGAALPRHNSSGQPASRSEVQHNDRGQDGKSRSNGTGGAIGSPGGARGFGGASSDPKVYAEMVRHELRAAAQICPRIASLITPTLLSDPSSASPEDGLRVAAAAAELLPQPERNNDRTALWGWAKHGIRVLVMLAIALEDPDIRNPCSYFGKLTSQGRGATDLRLNLARILVGKGTVPTLPEPQAADAEAQVRRLAADLEALPGCEDPNWQEIARLLRIVLGEGRWGSWFSRVGFHGICDGALTLSAATNETAKRIKADFGADIISAAKASGVFVARVDVKARSACP